MKTPLLYALLIAATPTAALGQPAAAGDAVHVSDDLAKAHDALAVLIGGVGESARVSYEQDDDVIRFRIEPPVLGRAQEALAEGEISVGPDGLRRFRITGGANYARLWSFRRRVRALRLPDADAEVLLDTEQPRFSRATKDAILSALPARLLSSAAGEELTLEQVSFEGRAAGASLGDEPVAAWAVRVRAGAGTRRRFVLTVDPFTGAVVGAERR